MQDSVTAGDAVVDFKLKDRDGALYDSGAKRRSSLLAYTFFHTGCGTCRLTMPFLQRLHARYSSKRFAVVGISQDDGGKTRAYSDELGLTFPILLDSDLLVTQAHIVEYVPGIFLVGPEDKIILHSHCFATDTLNQIAQRAGEMSHIPYEPVVRLEDNAPMMKLG